MKKFLSLLCCCALAHCLLAQRSVIHNPERAVIRYPDDKFCDNICLPLGSNLVDSKSRSISRPEAPGSFFINTAIPVQGEPFVAVSVVWYTQHEVPDSAFQFMAYGFEGGDSVFFHEKIAVRQDGHAGHQHEEGKTEHIGKHVSQLMFVEPKHSKFLLSYTHPMALDSIAIHFFNPGDLEGAGHPVTVNPQIPNPQSPIPSPKSQLCECAQPDYQSRSEWCPTGDCPPSASPVPTVPTHLIIHHSAGGNVASDWAAVVRSIWDFHVNVNGWADIGYNWLVDPNGVLYAGRGDNIIGAHFCGFNNKTMGVCMMGDFTDITPSAASIGTLQHLLAWKACDLNLDPLGTSYHASSALTLKNISGHQDGCATACPGASFYPTLQSVRDGVQGIINNECNGSSVSAPTTLTAQAVGGTQVDLTWADNSSNEEAFVLERSHPANTNYQPVAELPANSTAHSDLTVTAGLGYFYRVKAQNADVESGYSNEVYVVVAPSAEDSEEGKETLRFFPNPSGGQATVVLENQWVGTMQVSVFDALGRLVLPAFKVEKAGGNASFELDLSGLATGLFVLKIEREGGASFLKFEKM